MGHRADSTLPDVPHGAATKERFFAAWFDHALSVLACLAVMLALPDVGLFRLAAAAVGYLGYSILAEGAFGATPGKALFGFRVIDAGGGPCSLAQATVRTLARVVEANPALFGGLPAGLIILASRRGQR
jgi:uncharacterized RDD family membrane protein YckC